MMRQSILAGALALLPSVALAGTLQSYDLIATGPYTAQDGTVQASGTCVGRALWDGTTPYAPAGVSLTADPQQSTSCYNPGSNLPPIADVNYAVAPPTTPARVLSTASTNAVLIKAAAGIVYGYQLCNGSSQTRYIRLFDLAVAPTVGSSTPTMGPIVLQGGACSGISLPGGAAFLNGISYDITAGPGDGDATPISADDVSGSIFYN